MGCKILDVTSPYCFGCNFGILRNHSPFFFRGPLSGPLLPSYHSRLCEADRETFNT